MSNRGAPFRTPAPPRQRINNQIRVREVRLIGEDGAQLGVMPTSEAMRLAEEASLDLVEVQANVDPPVCRLMNYGRMRYEQDRRERESKKAQKTQELKEVRLSPDTDQHDLDTKRRRAASWLKEGNKVQLNIRMRGREQAHPDVARRVLSEMAATLTEVGHIERDALAQGRTISMVLAPGPAPARRAQAPTPRPQPAPAQSPQTQSPQPQPAQSPQAPQS